ncbi:efflux RND transporter periplasmic adaptor subunit [Marinobacter sp. 2_MG-2023]|uniref:efflux RND transporter periplasmic adaptor subunit n=1 Tax=Marinobacter sp. 2_MG-2023 TaxID=3062679 RepID=UPI0026E324C3|nr:efflux RND transporter periplasmic adaptor subunit [Marinobacter sp. 2_MG-2023]MDO6441278.1 efflux RND transporter periplasmic adaptor subunit [Marinobacter sp. 2_MG-2023]
MIRPYAKWLVLLAAVGVLISVFLYNSQKLREQESRPLPAKEDSGIAPNVGVIPAITDSHAVNVEAFGAAKSRYEITLTAQVSGQVSELASAFESGRIVKKGDLLLTLEDSDYRAALASAENDLASAQLDLLEAEREAKQAVLEWQASGMTGEPDSPLVLHEPQVKQAQAAVANAEAAVASAEKDVAQTRVRAPFDALVVSRTVSPGSYLQAGNDIAELYSADRIEISLPISQLDWQKLPDIEVLDKGEWPVSLFSVETGQQWHGYIQRTELHLDDTTRQQSVIAALERPLEQADMLAPGAFLRAEIAGRELSDLWRLPSSSLSQRGEVWYVDNGVLARFSADPVASDEQAIYIRPPASLYGQTVNVLTHPLSTYMPGMAVNPVEASDD